MSLETPLAVLFAILFVVPGFLWLKIAIAREPYAKRRKTDWLECLALSCFNYLIASPVVYFLLICFPNDIEITKPGSCAGHPWYFLVWGLVVFILPVVCGFVTGYLAKKDWLKGFLRRFGISVLHPAPSAWDYVFARNERYWARVELSDGSVVEGIFDSNSLASGEPDEHDLFLETVFEWDEQSRQYKHLDRNAGVWLSAQGIRTITFFTLEAEDGGVQQRDSAN
jgi:hypothetical protein